MDNDIFATLEETYGLELLLEQNDIEPWEVIKILYERGLLDIDDYIFTNLNEDELNEND